MNDFPAELFLVLGGLALAHWLGDVTESAVLRRTTPAPEPSATSALWLRKPRAYSRRTSPSPSPKG